MNEKEIRDRHNELEGLISTQSTSAASELKSQAHKDRDWLLKELNFLKKSKADLFMEYSSLKESLSEELKIAKNRIIALELVIEQKKLDLDEERGALAGLKVQLEDARSSKKVKSSWNRSQV